MEEHLKNNWIDKLPTHKPKYNLWDKIELEMDLDIFSENYENLPKYYPSSNLWKTIKFKLSLIQYFKYYIFLGAGIFSSLFYVLLFNHNGSNSKNNFYNVKKEFSIEKEINNTKEHFNLSEEFNNIQNVSIINKPLSKVKPIIQNQNQEQKSFFIKKEIEEKKLTEHSEIKETTNYKLNEINDYKAENTNENNNLINNNYNLKTDIEDSENQNIKPIDKKSISVAKNNKFIGIGIEYGLFNVNNMNESFSYSNSKLINKYGLKIIYKYSGWLIQTGLNYNRFDLLLNRSAFIQQNNYLNYNYVDSVLYNQQGEIIQYITHPVIINDSVITPITVISESISHFINIPLLIGYQINANKLIITPKAGLECMIKIFEKDNFHIENVYYQILLTTENRSQNIQKLNWAGIFSVEISYNLTKNWYLYTEPTYMFYLKPFYKINNSTENEIIQKPKISGIKFGVFYKF